MSNIPDTVVRIPITKDIDFFKEFLRFLSPIHTLTTVEQTLLAHFLKERYELS
jgi:hypothetical protein